MNTDIFIVSCAKHVEYLKYSLRSLKKFASGFHAVVLMFPRHELEDLYHRIDTKELRDAEVKAFDEWPEKGMLHHELLEMTAPAFCYGADCILHWDSDYVATEPITPGDFIVEDKPVMVWAPYDWLIQQQPNLRNWQEACRLALGYAPEGEFMRRPGLCHIREVYPETVKRMEAHIGQGIADFYRAGKNTFPQDRVEYPLLGEVAWQRFHDRYIWIKQGVDPFPPIKITQTWSHGPITKPQNIWLNGTQQVIIPKDYFESLGLGDHRPSLSHP